MFLNLHNLLHVYLFSYAVCFCINRILSVLGLYPDVFRFRLFLSCSVNDVFGRPSCILIDESLRVFVVEICVPSEHEDIHEMLLWICGLTDNSLVLASAFMNMPIGFLCLTIVG